MAGLGDTTRIVTTPAELQVESGGWSPSQCSCGHNVKISLSNFLSVYVSVCVVILNQRRRQIFDDVARLMVMAPI